MQTPDRIFLDHRGRVAISHVGIATLSAVESYIHRLIDDGSLTDNMDAATTAIFMHAAGEYIREMARRGGDLEKAWQVAKVFLQSTNSAIWNAAHPITLEEMIERR